MAEESTEEQVDLELEEQPQGADTNNRSLTRNKELADRLKATGEAQAKAEAKAEAAAKERDFYKGFNSMASKYQGAADFQDKILEKVKAGYDIEDATVAVMSREGRLNQPQAGAEAPIVESRPQESPAGGSAVTNVAAGSERKPSEMTTDELRSALVEAEKRGDLGLR